MKLLVETAVLRCAHGLGVVQLQRSQSLVKIARAAVLVHPDPEQRPIASCPSTGIGILPCTTSLSATAGYSTLVKIEGRPACLDTVKGLTVGSPPGTVNYTVATPGQTLVTED